MKPITETEFTPDLLTNAKFWWNRRTADDLFALAQPRFEELLSIAQSNKKVFGLVSTTTETLPGWGSIVKGCALAGLVLAMKPKTCVEIGVMGGRSLFPIAWAAKENGVGEVIGIDPYDPDISARDQFAQHAEFWQSVPHDGIHSEFVSMVKGFGLSGVVKLIRQPSEKVTPMPCQLIHFDASAGEPTVADAERFGPLVELGGVAVFSSILWVGGSVLRAIDVLEGMGFVERFRHSEQWNIMQRVK